MAVLQMLDLERVSVFFPAWDVIIGAQHGISVQGSFGDDSEVGRAVSQSGQK